MKKYALFIGRWQTLHEGHRWLFRQKIEQGIPVCIAVRNVGRDERNPYNGTEVVEKLLADKEIQDCIATHMLTVILIPDIVGVYYGRDVGYEVQELVPPSDIADISGTKIREERRENAAS